MQENLNPYARACVETLKRQRNVALEHENHENEAVREAARILLSETEKELNKIMRPERNAE